MIKPKWLRSRYQLKKEIRRRFVEEATTKCIKILIEEEVKIIFGDGNREKPVGFLNVYGGENGNGS